VLDSDLVVASSEGHDLVSVGFQRYSILLCFALMVSCASEEREREIGRLFEPALDVPLRKEGSRIPWTVGQRALFRLRSSSSEGILHWFGSEARGLREYSITGREGEAYWLEVHEAWANREVRCSFLVEGVSPEGIAGLRVVRRRVLGEDGTVLEATTKEALPSEARALEECLEQLVATSAREGGTGTVRPAVLPAGRFEETWVVPVSTSTTSGRSSGHVWFSTTVPIVHRVRTTMQTRSWIWFESTLVEEVTDFALEGARSALPLESASPSQSVLLPQSILLPQSTLSPQSATPVPDSVGETRTPQPKGESDPTRGGGS